MRLLYRYALEDLWLTRISEAHLYLLNAWREGPGYSPRERAALEWAEAVTKLTNQDVSDETYRVVREQFTETEVANLTLAIVAINGWNRLNIAFHNRRLVTSLLNQQWPELGTRRSPALYFGRRAIRCHPKSHDKRAL